MSMPATYTILKRAASAAFLLSLLGACQDIQTPTAPLDLQPRLTQLAASPVVNSLADPGTGTCDDTECTLREAIAFASSGATITFSVAGTITLSGSQLSIARSMTISGPGATQLTVNGNGASRVFMVDAATTITGMTIKGGYVGSGGGGGLMAWASLTLIDCTVSGNSSLSSVAGGIYQVSGTLLVLSSAVSGNTGHPSAGGVYSQPGTTMTFRNSTVSTNYAVTGGLAVGINSRSTLLQIDHSTVAGNGIGILVDAGAAEVKGSLISGNSEDISLIPGTVTSLGHNLIGSTYPVSLLTEFTEAGDQTGVTNALLDTLALNGPGATRTHALLEGSPAIDAGICTDITGATLSTDQRGVSRPQGSACDIGSYERQASGGTTPTFVFSLSALPAKTFGDGSFSVTTYATTNSTGAMTFATGTGSVGCSVTSGGTVSITGAAINPDACILEASLGADATYTSAGPISQSFNIAKATGSVTISNIPGTATVGGSFTPTYTKSGDGIASTVSNSTGICTVSSGVVNYITTGTCLLQASVTEGTNHLAATGTEQSFTVAHATPTFTFDVSTLGTVTYGNVPFSISGFANTNSSGYISFATGAGSVGCSVTTGGTLTITGAAVDPSHCIIEATLAADGTYSGAGPISQSFNIAKAAGSVTISNLPSSGAVGGNFTPTYSKSGDGTPSTVSNSTSICTVTSGVVDYIAAGTCLLQASITEGTNHLAATASEQSFTISAVTPTFAFDLSGLATKTYGDGSFSVAGYATTNSTGTISFATGGGSAGCSVTPAGMVTITGAAVDPAHCIVAATLAADGGYTGAGPIEQSINIAKATGSVSINNMPASPTAGSNFTPAFTKMGDGAASVISLTTGVCTVDGGVVSFIAAGTCTLQASVGEGANYLAATASGQNVVVSAAGVFASSCTYTINPKNLQRHVAITWENAIPGVTQVEVTDGRITTRQLAPTTSGSWSTNVKTGTPSYGLWGGSARRDTTTVLVPAGTACEISG
jgi:CSLREA domain-containing protein